jgi:aryl-alcohol dehydrogenase-like predicted oxidoreductase
MLIGASHESQVLAAVAALQLPTLPADELQAIDPILRA